MLEKKPLYFYGLPTDRYRETYAAVAGFWVMTALTYYLGHMEMFFFGLGVSILVSCFAMPFRNYIAIDGDAVVLRYFSRVEVFEFENIESFVQVRRKSRLSHCIIPKEKQFRRHYLSPYVGFQGWLADHLIDALTEYRCKKEGRPAEAEDFRKARSEFYQNPYEIDSIMKVEVTNG